MSMSRTAAYTTIAPSAAVGKVASSPWAKSMTASSRLSATREYIWVRAPANSPSAVRLALLLTGKPWHTADPMLHRPSARNSALASMVSPFRAANTRALSTLSENATSATPPDAAARVARSDSGTLLSPTGGKPSGTAPMTPMPCRSSENTATAADASATAMNGPGARGTIRASTSSAASTAADSARVGQCTFGRAWANERTSAMKPSPVTVVPVNLPSCPATMISATPAI